MFPHGNGAVKARLVTDMAGTTQATHLHPQHHRILVAIDAQFHHLLGQSTGGSLMPDFLPAAAPVDRLAQPYGFLQRLLVHEGDHQDIPGLVIHRHCRHQSVLVKFGCQLEPFFQFFLGAPWRESDLCHGQPFNHSPGKPKGIKPIFPNPSNQAIFSGFCFGWFSLMNKFIPAQGTISVGVESLESFGSLFQVGLVGHEFLARQFPVLV